MKGKPQRYHYADALPPATRFQVGDLVHTEDGLIGTIYRTKRSMTSKKR
jgi:hypothetical protein